MECLQTGGLTGCHALSQEAPGEVLLGATGAPDEPGGKFRFRGHGSIRPRVGTSTCTTFLATYTQTDPADVELMKFHTCCQNSRFTSRMKDSVVSAFLVQVLNVLVSIFMNICLIINDCSLYLAFTRLLNLSKEKTTEGQ